MYGRDDGLPPLLNDIPQLLGFGGLADHPGVGLAPQTVRRYWLKDLVSGYWSLVPRPDVVLLGVGRRMLPGWTPETAGIWVRTRPGRWVEDTEDPAGR